MKKSDKLSNSIGNIHDKYLAEALEHREKPAGKRKILRIVLAAAGVCLAVGVAASLHKTGGPSVTVYAFESDQPLTYREPVLMTGKINDNGSMTGVPLRFYLLGSGIESVRFSCRNQWISFMDWTEQREDFGISRNFTVPYGADEKEYYYLVISWEPESIIRKLTDTADTIADLQSEEKEDVIVMEVTYLNGGSETLAVKVRLSPEGQFMAEVSDYKITAEDTFVFQPDNLSIQEKERRRAEILAENPEGDCREKDKISDQQDKELAEDSPAMVQLSEEELARVEAAIDDYYSHTVHKVYDYWQIAYDGREEYRGYGAEEIVVFEVVTNHSEINRTITIGSTDGWNNCVVLNEGY